MDKITSKEKQEINKQHVSYFLNTKKEIEKIVTKVTFVRKCLFAGKYTQLFILSKHSCLNIKEDITSKAYGSLVVSLRVTD